MTNNNQVTGEITFDLTSPLQRSMHYHAVFGHCYFDLLKKIGDAARTEIKHTNNPFAEKVVAILSQGAGFYELEMLKAETRWWREGDGYAR